MELSRIIISEQNDQQVIYLKEIGGARTFPILIGIWEAGSIDRRVKGQQFARPLTHNLIVNLVEHLGGEFQDVLISELKDHTYFARLRVRHEGELVEIDARPSDAIAVAVTCNPPLPIFVNEDVLNDVLGEELTFASDHFVGELPQERALAFSPCRPSTMTLMRTSVVLIRSTLIPSAASDWKRRLATLVWLFMPTPKTESLATLGQWSGGGQPSNSACSLATRRLLGKSFCRTVKEMLACPCFPTLCTIMSTTMPASAISSNTWAASPGMSGSPRTVTLACDSSRLTSSMMRPSIFSMRATISARLPSAAAVGSTLPAAASGALSS